MTQNKSAQFPQLAQRIGGKVSALLRQNPRLARGEALRQYAHLAVQRDILEQAMLDGTMDERKWRALSEVSRMLISLGKSLGLVAAEPKAGEEALLPIHDPDDYSDLSPEVRRMMGKE